MESWNDPVWSWNMLSSKESVANEILAWAKRRIMNNPIGEKELENLLAAVRAAGRAEGYAQAKYEAASILELIV